jgi:hypothetical protein
MKAYEEDWKIAGQCVVTIPGAIGVFMATPERAKLAAQAPAMARLLLKMRHQTQDICAWCSRTTELCDCEVAKVLRAAGVESA